MILKATLLGKHLAQHPYHQIHLLDAGVELTGPKESRIIAFNQIVSFSCKRGLIWGELAFELANQESISIHGLEWQSTQAFYDLLLQKWQHWSRDMQLHTTQLLEKQILRINELSQRHCYLPQSEFLRLAKEVALTYQSLPIPEERIAEFKGLVELDYLLQQWHHEGIDRWHEHNHEWTIKIKEEHSGFFAALPIELDHSQSYVVLQQEPLMLMLGAPGSGKSSVLLARAAWLLYQHELALDTLTPVLLPILPNDLLLLSSDPQSKAGLSELRKTFKQSTINQLLLQTPYELAFYLLKQTSKKEITLFNLLEDTPKREAWLLNCWQQLCSSKKAFAKLWRKFLSEQYEWELIEGDFWLEPDIAVRMGSRLDRWLRPIRYEKANTVAKEALALIKASKQSQANAVHRAEDQHSQVATLQETYPTALMAPDEAQIAAERKLFNPIFKAWKDEIKAQKSIDEPDAIIQAIKAVGRAKFVTPWRHILIDNYQEFPLLARLLIKGLKEKSIGAHILFSADDAQILTVGQTPEGVDEFIEEAKSTPEDFVVFELEQDHRLPANVRQITDTFINQNPIQQVKPFLVPDIKTSRLGVFAQKLMAPKHQNGLYTADESKLLDLLDTLSSYAPRPSTVLFTAQYTYQIPNDIIQLKMRWPHLNFIVKPFSLLHGIEVDFTFVLGLQQFGDSFPAFIRDIALEKHLLEPMETFLDAEMRRWLYVAMTRARQSTWIIHDKEKPSIFIKELQHYGAKALDK